jgi:tetratricopeptide (TPR) repeat protein
MGELLKYFRNGIFIYGIIILLGCDNIPLQSRIQYFHTSQEIDSLESRISAEIFHMYEGSLLRQSKLDTLIAINPEKEEYYRRKSFAHTRIGDYHLAFPLIQKAVQLDPFNALYFAGWQLLYMYRDYDRALDYYTYYDDINPGVDYIRGENVNFLKGLAYKQKGNYDEAVKEFDLCILHEKEGVSEYVYVYRGIANLKNECLEASLEDFDIALEKFPNCTMAYVYKGEALINLNRLNEAETELLKARKLLSKGVKKNHPYVEVFDEVHLYQVDELLDLVSDFTS